MDKGEKKEIFTVPWGKNIILEKGGGAKIWENIYIYFTIFIQKNAGIYMTVEWSLR